MSSTDLYTIGYQGRSIDNLIEILRSNNIETVVDIRELPLSRMRGFSKTRLSQALELAGIRYVSIRKLGSPRDFRHEYRQTQDWNLFARRFETFLQTKEKELEELTQRVYEETTCLLCFERESNLCHRSIVANAIKSKSDNGLRISHL